MVECIICKSAIGLKEAYICDEDKGMKKIYHTKCFEETNPVFIPAVGMALKKVGLGIGRRAKKIAKGVAVKTKEVAKRKAIELGKKAKEVAKREAIEVGEKGKKAMAKAIEKAQKILEDEENPPPRAFPTTVSGERGLVREKERTGEYYDVTGHYRRYPRRDEENPEGIEEGRLQQFPLPKYSIGDRMGDITIIGREFNKKDREWDYHLEKLGEKWWLGEYHLSMLVTLKRGKHNPEENPNGYEGWSSHEAWELHLAITNDEYLYNWYMGAWLKNYERRMKKGTYHRVLAVHGIRDVFIPKAITKLRKEGLLMYKTYPMAVKQEVAEALVEEIEEGISYRGAKSLTEKSGSKPTETSEDIVKRMRKEGKDWSDVVDWITRQVGYDIDVIKWARKIYYETAYEPPPEKSSSHNNPKVPLKYPYAPIKLRPGSRRWKEHLERYGFVGVNPAVRTRRRYRYIPEITPPEIAEIERYLGTEEVLPHVYRRRRRVESNPRSKRDIFGGVIFSLEYAFNFFKRGEYEDAGIRRSHAYTLYYGALTHEERQEFETLYPNIVKLWRSRELWKKFTQQEQEDIEKEFSKTHGGEENPERLLPHIRPIISRRRRRRAEENPAEFKCMLCGGWHKDGSPILQRHIHEFYRKGGTYPLSKWETRGEENPRRRKTKIIEIEGKKYAIGRVVGGTRELTLVALENPAVSPRRKRELLKKIPQIRAGRKVRPPKEWWTAMRKSIKEGYPRERSEAKRRYEGDISRITGGIWAKYRPEIQKSIIKKIATGTGGIPEENPKSASNIAESIRSDLRTYFIGIEIGEPKEKIEFLLAQARGAFATLTVREMRKFGEDYPNTYELLSTVPAGCDKVIEEKGEGIRWELKGWEKWRIEENPCQR